MRETAGAGGGIPILTVLKVCLSAEALLHRNDFPHVIDTTSYGYQVQKETTDQFCDWYLILAKSFVLHLPSTISIGYTSL
jgi:hypothetical protein